jgi:hypothetical protein
MTLLPLFYTPVPISLFFHPHARPMPLAFTNRGGGTPNMADDVEAGLAVASAARRKAS